MHKQKLGLIIFWVGALYFFVGGWFVNWWIVPMYKTACLVYNWMFKLSPDTPSACGGEFHLMTFQ